MGNNFIPEQKDYDFFHFVSLQIRFNDIDIMGHVNNAIFQDYFDYARLSYFSEVFGEPVLWGKTSLILAAIYIDYIHPVHIDQKIEVATKTTVLGNKSLQMVQEIHKLPERKKMAFSRAVLVAFDASGDCSVMLPVNWKKDILAFEKEVEFKHSSGQRKIN